jgi:hypothetical protein
MQGIGLGISQGCLKLAHVLEPVAAIFSPAPS